MITKQTRIQHLHLRSGFGVAHSEVKAQENLSIEKIVEELFVKSAQYTPLTTLKNPLRKDGKELSNFRVAIQLLRSREQVKQLNLGWLDKMTHDSSLREKMTFFWHGHFATKVPFAYLLQIQNNTLREHALGSFRDLLHAISKDPAMLIFLNNQQNKKKSPNENFARELLELFTLGEGQIYSEKDIKEAARAFTGWRTNKAAQYDFNQRTHDFGIKEFLGKKGDFNGNDIIDMILEKPETAEFITEKIYKFLVNDIPQRDRINALSKAFFESDYDISLLLRKIFTADWFYERDNIGSQIVSPVQLIVRYRQLFNIKLKDDETWLRAQTALGQTLFNPPNVAGWSGGKSWIDSSSLLFRMNLAPLLFEYKNVAKWSDNKSDWKRLRADFEHLDTPNMVKQIASMQIQAPITPAIENNILQHINSRDRVKSVFVRTMMLPEFQLI